MSGFNRELAAALAEELAYVIGALIDAPPEVGLARREMAGSGLPASRRPAPPPEPSRWRSMRRAPPTSPR